MPSYKNARAVADVRQVLSELIPTLKDPRVTGLLSIVKLELARDYSHCTVYLSSMDGLEGAKSAVEGLRSAQGHLRRELGLRLRLRRTPELHFVPDNGIEYSARLGQRFRELHIGQPADSAEDVENNDG